MSVIQPSWSGLLEQPYNHYFRSRHYDARYPGPNPATLGFLARHEVECAAHVLDVGCGNGRYAMPLLDRLHGHWVGCDISAAALEAFRARLEGHRRRDVVSLVHGEVGALPADASFDRILMLFGVLSHIGPRIARVAALRQIRARASSHAKLLLSVPSIWRRMPLRLLRSLQAPRDAWGDVAYQREINGLSTPFLYHLYGLGDLRRELREGGWVLMQAEPESVLPEAWVCRSAAWARMDRGLRTVTPSFLGYGIRVMAMPLHEGDPA